MSMITANKLEKTKHLKSLLSQLWQGNTAIALELGSRALSLLKVAELNGQWQQLWFPAPAA